MMIFNSSTKKRDIDKMTQTFKDNKNRKTFYQKSCNKLQKEYGTEAMETFRATFSDQFDEEKRKNRLATFGVTDATSQNEAIY
jgi:outer membrane protein assembly factor BamD (BamD/ComL family)